MSFNTKKQRQHLYNLTFLKWTLERRLSTLQQSTIETTLAIHVFGNKPTQDNFIKLSEALSDLETMIEVHELTYPALRQEMDKIQKQKLITLKKQNALESQASRLETKATEKKEAAAKIPDLIKKQKEQKAKNTIWKRLFRI